MQRRSAEDHRSRRCGRGNPRLRTAPRPVCSPLHPIGPVLLSGPSGFSQCGVGETESGPGLKSYTDLSIHGARIQVRADCLDVPRRHPRAAVQSALFGVAAVDVVGTISRRASQSGFGPDWIEFWGLDDPSGRHTEGPASAGMGRRGAAGGPQDPDRAMDSCQLNGLHVGGAGSATSSLPTTSPKPARRALVGRPRPAPMSRS
jgi:hypothetical protein